MLQWDATSLITCAKFQVNGRLVLDYALSAGKIVIVQEVQQETVEAGLAGGYPDAVELKTRIETGQITVRTGAPLSPSFEVADGAFTTATGQQLLLALRSRLPVGFVEHSLRRLEGVL